MLKTPFCRLVSFIAVLFALAAAARAEHPIITKARAYLGSDAALNAVQSVHYTGSLMAPNPADPKALTRVTIEIIFKAPYRQRTILTSERSITTTALDNYDGWEREQDPKDASRWRLKLVAKDQIKQLRANTWENLAYYRGLEHLGGKVLDQGPATIDGVACQKFAFIHDDDIVFYRYFDPATGRLVLTETEKGNSIREQGEIMVNGIRFPKAIVSSGKGADGKEQSVTITFDTVTLNESFPDSLFAIPALNGK